MATKGDHQRVKRAEIVEGPSIEEIRALGERIVRSNQGREMFDIARGVAQAVLEYKATHGNGVSNVSPPLRQGRVEQIEQEALPPPVILQSPSLEKLFDELCQCPDKKGVKYKVGQPLYQAGEPATSLLFVREGIVKLEYLNLSGKRIVLALCYAGEIISEEALRERQAHVVSAVAVSNEVRACQIRRGELIHVLKNNNRLAMELISQLSALLTQQSEAAFRLASVFGTKERLAFAIHQIAQRFGRADNNGVISIGLHLKREELARIIGSSSKTVIRHLQEWRERGWLRFNAVTDKIEIVDPDAIKRIAAEGLTAVKLRGGESL